VFVGRVDRREKADGSIQPAGIMPDNQVISNTGFESPCSTKGVSCRFSPLETPSALCPPQEAGFTLNEKFGDFSL